MIPDSSFEGCETASPIVTCGVSIANPSFIAQYGSISSALDVSEVLEWQIMAWILIISTTVSYIQPYFQPRLDSIHLNLHQRKALRISFKTFWVPLKISYVIVFILFMINESTSLLTFLYIGGIDTTSWGIGQIVGISVWIPLLLEFFQLYSSEYLHYH